MLSIHCYWMLLATALPPKEFESTACTTVDHWLHDAMVNMCRTDKHIESYWITTVTGLWDCKRLSSSGKIRSKLNMSTRMLFWRQAFRGTVAPARNDCETQILGKSVWIRPQAISQVPIRPIPRRATAFQRSPCNNLSKDEELRAAISS